MAMVACKSVIYRIFHVDSGNEYIGSSKDYRLRWVQHRTNLRCGRHHSIHLQRAYNKYGSDAFQYEVLEYVPDVDMLIPREQYYIQERQPVYNIMRVASTPPAFCHSPEAKQRNREAHLGMRHSVETRLKMSKTRKGMRLSAEGRLRIAEGARKRYSNPEEREKSRLRMMGRSQSPETLAKMAAGHQAWLATPESRVQLRQRALKQFSDPVARQKLGSLQRGRKQSPEHIAKARATRRLTTATPDYKVRISAIRKGVPKSKETRAHMSASQRKRLDNPELRVRIAQNTREQHRRMGTYDKLIPDQVREIRAKFQPYYYTKRQLSREYGVSEGVIKGIVLGKTWLDVE